MDNGFDTLIKQLPPWLGEHGKSVPIKMKEQLTELRIFVDKPLVWVSKGKCYLYDDKAITQKQMEELFYWVCQGSVHSHQRELCEGFVTLSTGQRVGICGTAVYRDNVQIGMENITSMSIRFSRPWTGCAEIFYESMKDWHLEKGSFLLAGPPSSGKTTLLRDYIRILTTRLCPVAVLDERGELSAYDLGMTAHVLKAIPKEKAILQALRTLSPQLIVCDELGSIEEANALLQGLNGGCRFIGSIHASTWQELQRKEQFTVLLEHDVLDAVVLLDSAESPGQIREIIPIEEGYHAHRRLRTDFSFLHSTGLQL